MKISVDRGKRLSEYAGSRCRLYYYFEELTQYNDCEKLAAVHTFIVLVKNILEVSRASCY